MHVWWQIGPALVCNSWRRVSSRLADSHACAGAAQLPLLSPGQGTASGYRCSTNKQLVNSFTGQALPHMKQSLQVCAEEVNL